MSNKIQLTKGELRQIISEELERAYEGLDEVETLTEGYARDYSVGSDSVSKDALIDFLEVLEEGEIPREAFDAFMENLPEHMIKNVLGDILED